MPSHSLENIYIYIYVNLYYYLSSRDIQTSETLSHLSIIGILKKKQLIWTSTFENVTTEEKNQN